MEWLLGGPAAPFLGEQDNFGAARAPPLFPGNFPGAVFNPPSPTPSIDLPEYDFSPGYGPEPDTYLDLPTPTPALSDGNLEHFMPPGYGPVPGLELLPQEEETSAPVAAAPLAIDLNVEPEDEETSAPVAAAPLAFDLNVEPEDEETSAPVAAAPFALELKAEVEPKDEETGAQAPLPAGPAPPPPEARRLLRRFAAAMASRQPSFRAGSWNPASLGFSNLAMPNTSLPDGSTDEERRGGSCSRRW
jgi:hypothetical protein